jgi:hypothetical protein
MQRPTKDADMATHAHTTDDRTPMDPMRRTALVAGGG